MKRRVTKKKVKKQTGKARKPRSHDKERQVKMIEDPAQGFPSTLDRELVWCSGSESSVEPKNDGWNTTHASKFWWSQFGIKVLNHHNMVAENGKHDLHLKSLRKLNEILHKLKMQGLLEEFGWWIWATSRENTSNFQLVPLFGPPEQLSLFFQVRDVRSVKSCEEFFTLDSKWDDEDTWT